MKTWFIERWTDPAKFAATCRMLLFALGTVPELANLGAVGEPAWYVGKVLQIASLMVRAGDRIPS
jgi:hypothetical protein